MTFKDITSHEIACKVLGKDPVQSTTTGQQSADVVNAINKLHQNPDGSTGFKADFKNPDQRKWRPFFYVDASGLRFDDSYCDTSYSYTGVGSRLCDYMGSKEESDHFGTEFLDLHKAHFESE